MKTMKTIFFCILASTPFLLGAFACVRDYVKTKSHFTVTESLIDPVPDIYDDKDPFLIFIAAVLVGMAVVVCWMITIYID